MPIIDLATCAELFLTFIWASVVELMSNSSNATKTMVDNQIVPPLSSDNTKNFAPMLSVNMAAESDHAS